MHHNEKTCMYSLNTNNGENHNNLRQNSHSSDIKSSNFFGNLKDERICEIKTPRNKSLSSFTARTYIYLPSSFTHILNAFLPLKKAEKFHKFEGTRKGTH